MSPRCRLPAVIRSDPAIPPPERPLSGLLFVVLPTAALLLANVLRAYFPGRAMDVLFGVAILGLGSSLWRHRAPWPRATLLCFASLAALYGLGLAMELDLERKLSLEGARNLAAILCAALIFLFGFRNAPELARHRSLAAMLLIGAVALVPLYLAAPMGLHPSSIAGGLGYSLLAAGLILTAHGRPAWAHVSFGLAVAVGLAFGSRSLALAVLAGYASYWAGKFVLRDRMRTTGMAVCLGLLVCAPIFLLSAVRSMPMLDDLDDLARALTGKNIDSGREVLWNVALSRIAEAPWLGYGPDADLGSSSERPEVPTDRWQAGASSCVEQNSPGLAADCLLLLEVWPILAGPDWDSRRGWSWSAHRPLDEWPGVDLGGKPPRVIGLRLINTGLSGHIPPEMAELGSLRILDLSHNRLTGPIPPELGKLASLSELQLQNNRLSGVVPATLAQLDRLNILRLSHNRFAAPVPAALYTVADHDLAAHLLCLPMPLTPPALRADCATLLAMRDVLAGDAWLNWEQSLPIGSWQGVKLGGEPLRVTGLYLADARLNGRIPPELAELDGLSLLDLARNRLTGPVPPALGLLENLVELRIENNRLSGPIPELRLSNLSFASLGGNDFGDTGHSAGIPGDSASVPAETGGGPMRAASPVPETVGKDLFCRPSASPPELLADCKVLLAARTALAGDGAAPLLNWADSIPIAFWRGVTLGAEASTRVVAVDLSRMDLSGRIPPELGKLDGLRSLRLHRNRLGGPIPSELGALGNLRELALGMNALTGPVPPALGKLEQLRLLYLRRNRLTGPIPPELGKLAHLQALALGGNALEGAVPAALAAHEGLAVLRPGAGDASVAGEDRNAPPLGRLCLPPVLGDAKLLADCKVLLDVRDRLAGDALLDWSVDTPVDAWQGVTVGGSPKRVVAVELPGMELNGRLPTELAKLERLVSLRLQDNRLTGIFPPALGRLAELAVLEVDGNDLVGCMPPALARRARSRNLEVGLLCVPSAWAKPELNDDMAALMGVRDVLTGGAALNWDFARPVAEWQGVTVGGEPPRVVALDLSRMELDGSIPPQLAALEQLVELRLGDNRLAGPIPPQLGGLERLHWLDLSGNRLTGPIPPRLGGLGRLRWLDLNDNRLTGSVPLELGNLQLLIRLRAENNRLHGDLGDLFKALAGLTGLRSVWLHGNDVTGHMPLKFWHANPRINAALVHPFRWGSGGDAQGSETRPFGALIAEIGRRVPTSRSAPKINVSAHNLFLQVGVQRGVIGIAVLAALFTTLILGLAASREEVIEPARRLALAAMVTVIVHSTFEVFLLQNNVVVSTIAWLLIGLGAGVARAGVRRSST